MIETAIEKDNLEWLMYVWAFGKNYKGIRRTPKAEKINFSMFFNQIKTRFKKNKNLQEQERVLKAICEWKLEIDRRDNILQALLEIGEDDLCLEFMGLYKKFLTKKTFVYAL